MSSFKDFNINEDILKALDALGFESPTPVQERVLAQFDEEKKDMIAVAQTGTGKTAAFSIPILQDIDTGTRVPQAIILSPTRELAIQIGKDIKALSKYQKGVRHLCVYGGTAITNQIKDLKKGVEIVIGTPGRTVDLIKRKRLDLSQVEWLVLDEADEMLSMGFKEDLDFILSGTKEDKTTLLFSATLPKEILKISKRYLDDPVDIRVKGSAEGSKNIDYFYHLVEGRDKYRALKRVLDIKPDIYAIIFCRTRKETNSIAADLSSDGYNADVLNGDLSQAQRDNVMHRFREKQIQILVATDVAARGLDVNNLTHVIHYQLPDETEVFVHRSGRTGRAGNKGISVAILTPKDKRRISSLERAVGKTMDYAVVPGGREICELRLDSFIREIEDYQISGKTDLVEIAEARFKKITKGELINKLVSREMEKVLDYYKNAGDLNLSANRRDRDDRGRGKKDGRGRKEREIDPRDKGEGRKRKSSGKFSRFFINLGSNQDLNPKHIIEIVNKNMPKTEASIGSIDIMKDFSFFEIDSKYAESLEKSLNGAKFRKHKISVEPAQDKGGGGGGGRSRGGGGGSRRKSYSDGGGRRGAHRNSGSGKGPRKSVSKGGRRSKR